MPETPRNHLPVLFGYHASNQGNSHVPLSLCRHWYESGRSIRLTVPSADTQLSFPWLAPAMTGIRKTLVYRYGPGDWPRRAAEAQFSKAAPGSPAAYLWAGLSLDVFKRVHDAGTPIVMERINCHQTTARRILEKAHDQWGVKGPGTPSDRRIAEENEKLSLASAVFCPSPMVARSMVENHVPREKILETSYGWAPERFPDASLPRQEKTRPVFLFVGTLCLRKGVPLLLEAWRRAGINGDLILVGAMAPEISKQFRHLMEFPHVSHVPYTKGIGRFYRQADVFVFPTLEEGGPMVTYEAMAHGLAPLVTEMGAGAVGQDTVNALVLPDSDPDSWAEAMAAMADNADQRQHFGEQARLRARQFTWARVADQRAGLLEARFPDLWRR